MLTHLFDELGTTIAFSYFGGGFDGLPYLGNGNASGTVLAWLLLWGRGRQLTISLKNRTVKENIAGSNEAGFQLISFGRYLE